MDTRVKRPVRRVTKRAADKAPQATTAIDPVVAPESAAIGEPPVGPVASLTVARPGTVRLNPNDHPDYVEGLFEDPADDPTALSPEADRPVPLPGDLPGIPGRPPVDPVLPRPLPGPVIPLRFCGPVSGLYRQPMILPPIATRPTEATLTPAPTPAPIALLNGSFTVRVDVDRFYPQRRISIEATRLLPSRRAHVVAEVKSDRCNGLYSRRIEADIIYRDGDATLIPAGRIVFEAGRSGGKLGYGSYTLSIIPATGATRSYLLAFVSPEFDSVEFEVDCVANATPVVTAYDTSTHPNRPASLPAETVDLATVFHRAGFKVSMSPNSSTIPVADAGANGTWSDTEMHNAMVTYWSRFANQPQWAMWVLFAARHDQGRSLGGIMFDDIGPNHRQGTAIFTDSFIVDAPAGDPNPQAWTNRMVFWTAVHEMGHAFNLAHAWQKTLSTPWMPLQDESSLRSFMNYPFRAPFNQQTFFEDFQFRFSDSELVFMRHAPRRFVQMGNQNWFDNHGFEAPDPRAQAFALEIRPNREKNAFAFLEPVKLELKLTNQSGQTALVEEDCIADGSHIVVLVRRDGGQTRKWQPFITYCHQSTMTTLPAGQSLYASHFIGAATSGWLIDEPGFYTIQAATQIGGELILSNPLRIFVGTPASRAEEQLAPDYFSEDVARVLAFQGAPALDRANDVLREVVATAADSPAAAQATVALGDPLKQDFKVLACAAGRDEMAIHSVSAVGSGALDDEVKLFIETPSLAAQTLGHIDFRATGEGLATALADAGRNKQAKAVQDRLLQTMEARGVLPSVIAESRSRLERARK